MDEIRSKIKDFPSEPGIYLMKDSEGRVLYIGKAKNLRDRVSSYFQPSADLLQSRGPKIAEMIDKVLDVGFLVCASEVDAILQEARLIKDIQPPYNTQLVDGKSFPYLEISMKDDFPGIYVTREPREGSKLYGPFTSANDLRRVVQVIQRVFKFRTCRLDILEDDEKRRFFRPCILFDIDQCTAPCGDKIGRRAYRNDIKRLRRFLESDRQTTLKQLQKEMDEQAQKQNYEEAARLRDEITAIESLNDRGEVDEHIQPELFQVDPCASLERLKDLLPTHQRVRVIEGIDIAHIMGHEAVGSLVCFIDGRPFKKGYRRFRIKQIQGIDDYAMIQEVIRRRFRHLDETEELFPDILLIDGGRGQLNAAIEIIEKMPLQGPTLISLAKKEEIVFCQNSEKPWKLPRHDPALRLLQYVRDEAHRFAQHYFHILRQKQTFE